MPKVGYSEEERERIRAALVTTALDHMARQGIQHTTVEQIYTAVGISRTFFYTFFPTKEDLVVETLYCQQGKLLAYAEELMADPGIIRNRLKIRAAVNNARIFREIQKEYQSFSNYIWHWTDGQVIYEQGKTSSELSDRVSEDLKKRGMKFVGTTILYSYMQAVGIIYSHDDECFLAH